MILRFSVFLFLASALLATPWREVKRGNVAADSGDADRAQYHYLKAMEQGGDTNVVEYNIGNLLYERGVYDKAQEFFIASLDTAENLSAQSEALYNLGNSYFQAQQFEPAVNAYIESLKRNPEDADAKRNLEMALRMMQQQQQQQQQQGENQEQQDEQQQQQDQQDQQDQQQQQQQQQEQQQNQQEQEKQQQQQAQQEMSKEEAERLLNALLQDEQNTLEKVKMAQVKDRPKREKDW